MTDLASYINTLTETQGAAVVTVQDGWVLIFTAEMLRDLLDKAEEHGKVTIHVKSTGNLPKN